MQTELLNEALGDLFKEVDRLAERHREALEFVAASERTAFLHARMQSLHQALSELREAAALLRAIGGDGGGEEHGGEQGRTHGRSTPHSTRECKYTHGPQPPPP